MTPAARIQAAIELLAQVDALERPAEQVVSEFVRARRFMGSKDRRAVTDLVFTVLRSRARLDWHLARAGGAEPAAAERMAEAAGQGARARVLAALLLVEGRPADDAAGLFDGGRYHPAPLDDAERAGAAALQGRPLIDESQPAWVRLETPAWLMPALAQALGERLDDELSALGGEAPLDLRVNTLIGEDRGAAARALEDEGIATEPTPLSPIGLRVAGRRAVYATRAYQEGMVEVQDEGSQIVALMTAAAPGMAVADFCAGAGGKTLALAATMQDRGRLVALDVDGERLARAGPRLKRAGARSVERRLLDGPDDPWLGDQAGAFDRVLVDAPCSGVGAWRRHPDARWRLTEEALSGHLDAQDQVLAQAAGLVRPGGRLVYATCSLLDCENRERVEAFRRAHTDFAPLPVEQVWSEALGGTCPADGESLLLTPARHGTDGFFIAVLERRAAA